jgi:acyl carrier protein
MTAEFVERRVKELVADQLGLGLEDVRLESALTGDLGADTLDVLELVMAMEEEFELDIGDNDADRFKTIQDVVDYVSCQIH